MDQDKLAEQIRAAQAGEAHDAAVLKENIRNNKAQEGLRAQEIAAQRAYNMGRLGLDQQRFKHETDLYNKETAARQAGINAVTQAEEINKQVKSKNEDYIVSGALPSSSSNSGLIRRYDVQKIAK